MVIGKSFFKNQASSGLSEILGFCLVQLGILVQFLFIHLAIDETMAGSIGLLASIALTAMVFLFPRGNSFFPVLSIYWCLTILALVIAWFMLAAGTIVSPSAMVALIVPGIALFFLGDRHFLIWLIIIVALYTFMAFAPGLASDIPFPLPRISANKMAVEYWAISLVMLNACCFIFYFLGQMRQRLREQATVDPLTNVLNRRGIGDKLENEFNAFQRYGRDFSILILDADHFKKINDNYGHEAGDKVLEDLVKSAQSCLRTTDFVGRWGGEEFLVLLPQTQKDKAANVAERIRQSIEDLTVRYAAQEIRFTASIGCTTSSPEDGNIDMTIKRADEALYNAKNKGRNRVAQL